MLTLQNISESRKSEIRLRVEDYQARYKWYHQYEFYPGYKIKSQQKTEQIVASLDSLGLPEDVSGLRILDCGCCDGYFSLYDAV